MLCNSDTIYNQDLPHCCGCLVCARQVGKKGFLPLLLRFPSIFCFLFSIFFSLLSFSTLLTTTRWLRCCVHSDSGLRCSACPAFAVCVPLPHRSSVHKVAVHLSARREGLIERQGRGHQGAGSCRQANKVVEAFRYSYQSHFPFFLFLASCAFVHRAALFHSILCSAQSTFLWRLPNNSPTPPSLTPFVSCLSPPQPAYM